AYTVRLHFVEPNKTVKAGGRRFDILLQGAMAHAAYDIVADAKAALKATELSFGVTASGGAGITVQLSAKGYNNYALISGIEVVSASASGAPDPRFDLDYSPDGGATWTGIATGLPADRFGQGAYDWTLPADLDLGSNYLIRARAEGSANAIGA